MGKPPRTCRSCDLLKRYCHVDEAMTHAPSGPKYRQLLTLDETLQDADPAAAAGAARRPAERQSLPAPRPAQRRQRTLTALKRVLLRESQVQPVLVVFEDLHWIDSETQTLLDSLVESLPTARLLLLFNYRPEYQHGWGGKTYYTQLRLDPLPPASADAFLQALLGDDPSVAPLTQLLIPRTQGNPFFLEESLRTLVEAGVLIGEPGAYRLVQPVESLQVPATVQAVLAARIDRLAQEDKHLLQWAAVVGTDVPLPLLQASPSCPRRCCMVASRTSRRPSSSTRRGCFPEREYTFKHALTHEVAYNSLLQERRRVLHARIVEALESLAPDRAAEQVERLAHHALRGEVWAKALAYGRQAGEKALARSASREAVGYIEQALSALRICRRSATPLSRPLTSGWPCARRSVRLATWGVPCHTCARPNRSPMALDDPRRLGRVLLFLANHCNWVAAMTRPSPRPSAPSRSPRRAGMWSCGQTSTSAKPMTTRATIVGRLTLRWRPSIGRSATSAPARCSCPP